jgi:hypothetical protein
MTPRQPEQAQGANSGRRVARKLAAGNLEDERKHSLRCLAFHSSLPKALPPSCYQVTPSRTGPLELYFRHSDKCHVDSASLRYCH